MLSRGHGWDIVDITGDAEDCRPLYPGGRLFVWSDTRIPVNRKQRALTLMEKPDVYGWGVDRISIRNTPSSTY